MHLPLPNHRTMQRFYLVSPGGEGRIVPVTEALHLLSEGGWKLPRTIRVVDRFNDHGVPHEVENSQACAGLVGGTYDWIEPSAP